MGGEEERILYNIDVKMKTSRVINQEGMGECGAAAEIKTFSFRDSDDRSKYEEGNPNLAAQPPSTLTGYTISKKLTVEKPGRPSLNKICPNKRP